MKCFCLTYSTYRRNYGLLWRKALGILHGGTLQQTYTKVILWRYNADRKLKGHSKDERVH